MTDGTRAFVKVMRELQFQESRKPSERMPLYEAELEFAARVAVRGEVGTDEAGEFVSVSRSGMNSLFEAVTANA